MKVRIACDHCSSDLQIPEESVGKQVRCPACERVFTSSPIITAQRLPTRGDSRRSVPPNESEFDGSYFLALFAMAPAGMLYFLKLEPIAIGVASGLSVLGLIVALRWSWPFLTRFTAQILIVLVAATLTYMVHRNAEGSATTWGKALFAKVETPDTSPDLAVTPWADLVLEDANFAVAFPGSPAPKVVGDPDGSDIHHRECRFSKQGTTFALHHFDLTLVGANELTEQTGLTKMQAILRRTFFEGDGDHPKKIWYFEHPGLEYDLRVVGKTTRILVQAYLVRNRAYFLSVTSDKFEKISVEAKRMFESFRLLKYEERFRTPVIGAEPDWKALGREPIPMGKPVAVYRGHIKPISLATFMADGKVLFSGAGAEHLVRWNLATGHGHVVLNTGGFPYFAQEPSKGRIVAPMPNGVNQPTDLQFVEPETPTVLGRANTDQFGFDPDGRTVVTTLGRDLAAWDMTTGKSLWRRFAHAPGAACLALSRDGSLAATAGPEDPTIKLWDAKKQGGDLAQMKGHTRGPAARGSPIQQLAFSADGTMLASVGLDATAKLWSIVDLNRPKERASMLHDQPVGVVEFSNDGKFVATGDFQGVVRLWDPTDAKLLREFRTTDGCEPVQALRFTPDDGRLAVAVDLGEKNAGIQLYEVATLPIPAGRGASFFNSEEPPLLEPKK